MTCGGRSRAMDRYRARFEAAPDSLTNAILAGTLLHPLGLVNRRRFSADALERRVELGMLPIARRDIERLQQILALQPRLLDLQAAAAHAARAAAPRGPERSDHLARDSRRSPRRRRALARAAGRAAAHARPSSAMPTADVAADAAVPAAAAGAAGAGRARRRVDGELDRNR